MQVESIGTRQHAAVRLRTAGWRGKVRADWADVFRRVDLATWMDAYPHEARRQRMSRQVYYVRVPRGDLYVKVMIGTNENAIEQPTLSARLRWSLRPSRAVQTLRVCRRMLAAGIACPPPVLAARKWDGSMPTDIFISEGVDGREVGDLLKHAADNHARIAIAQRIAVHVARLHRAKFLHGDLLPNNLIAGASLEHLCFLDNDRTRYWPVGLSDQLRRENLAQFAFRLLKYGQHVSIAFLDAYATAAKWTPTRRDRNRDVILRDIQSRRERRLARKQREVSVQP